MSDWRKNIMSTRQPDLKCRMIIDFKDHPDLINWVKKKAKEIGCPESRIVKALIKTAIEDENKPAAQGE